MVRFTNLSDDRVRVSNQNIPGATYLPFGEIGKVKGYWTANYPIVIALRCEGYKGNYQWSDLTEAKSMVKKYL